MGSGFIKAVASLHIVALLLPSALAADPVAATRYYEDGFARFSAGDAPGAIIQLRNALQHDGAMLAAHLLLGRALLASGQFPAAEVALREALRLGVDASEVAIPLARLYSLGGRPGDLVERVPFDGLTLPLKAEILAMRGAAFAQLGDLRASERSFAESRELNPDSAVPLIAEVPVLLARGRLPEARALADKAIRLEPASADAWNMSASVAHAQGRADEALAGYGKALGLNPLHVDARAARSALLVDLGRDEEALQEIEALRKFTTGEPRSAYLASVIWTRRGERERAKAELLEVARFADTVPADWAAGREQLLMLGALAHFELRNLEKAKAYLGTLTSRYARNLAARKLLGQIYAWEGDAARALSMIEPVLGANPGDVQALYIAGESNYRLGRYASSAEMFERAARIGGGATPALSALGYSEIRDGKVDKGIAALESSLAQRPNDIAVSVSLATIYVKRGEREKALKLSQGLAERNAGNPVARNLAGVVKAAFADFDGAVRDYQAVIALAPDFLPARINLARVRKVQGRLDEARNLLRELSAKPAAEYEALIELGQLETEFGDQGQGLELLRKAVAKAGRDTRAARALAAAYQRLGRLPEALEAASELSAKHVDDPEVMEALGRVQLAVGNSKAASLTYNRIGRLVSDPESLMGAAEGLIAADDLESAEYHAHKMLRADPGLLAGQALLGRIRLARGAADEAGAIAARLISVQPRQPEGHALAAQVAYMRGNMAEAVQRQAKAVQLEATEANVFLLARMNVAAGDPPGALKVIDDWLAPRPEHLAALNLAGEIALSARKLGAARGYYERMLLLRPTDARALNNLAMLLWEQGDAKAEAVARRAFERAPSNPATLDTVGWILVNKGSHDEGLRHLREARLRSPGDPGIRRHYLEALKIAGRDAEVRQELAGMEQERLLPAREALTAREPPR